MRRRRSSSCSSTVSRQRTSRLPIVGVVLAALPIGLAGCVGGPAGNLFGQTPPASLAGTTPDGTAPSGGRTVALLLPMSGPNAFLGAVLEKAARLGLEGSGAINIVVDDTGSTPAGAAEAARKAVAAGAGLIIGPLTAADTAAVTPVAQSANVPVLAFTSDVAEARPGVWVLGVTPEQQVARLAEGLHGSGQTRVGALLSQDAFGNAMAGGLNTAAAAGGLAPPQIQRYGGGFGGINTGLRTLSDYAERHPNGGRTPPKPAASASGVTPGTPPDTAAPPDMPPLPIDALLLNATGKSLAEIISSLAFYDLSPDKVRIMGPGLWGAFAGKLRELPGAWYAAPDPQARLGYVQAYQARYHEAPRAITDIAYDAGALARATAGAGYSSDALTRPQGFAGTDGVFALRPDGHVRRELAIFEIQPGGGARVVQPAPSALGGGS